MALFKQKYTKPMVLRGAPQISIMAKMATRKTKQTAIKYIYILKKKKKSSTKPSGAETSFSRRFEEKKEANSIQPP